jgi:hypothetical protein
MLMKISFRDAVEYMGIHRWAYNPAFRHRRLIPGGELTTARTTPGHQQRRAEPRRGAESRKMRYARSWGPSGLPPWSSWAAGLARVTAVLTATSSTVPHSNTTRRTPHPHVVRSDQRPACIC